VVSATKQKCTQNCGREYQTTNQLGDTEINVRITYFREATPDDRVNRIKRKSALFWDFTQRVVVMPY
jgi:hypothetical protein